MYKNVVKEKYSNDQNRISVKIENIISENKKK